jgi:hypothetical protein
MSCSISWWNKQNLSEFFVFAPYFIEGGYYTKLFLMETNINKRDGQSCGNELKKHQSIMNWSIGVSLGCPGVVRRSVTFRRFYSL